MTQLRSTATHRMQLTLADILGISHPGDPQWDAVRGARFAACQRLFPMISGIALFYATCILLTLFGTVSAWLLLPWYGATVASLFSLMPAFCPQRDSAGRFSVRAVWKLMLIALSSGLLWTVPILFMMDAASPAQQLAVVTVTFAGMAGTGLVFQMPFSALSRLAVFTTALCVGLWAHSGPMAALATLAFSSCLSFAIFQNGRLFTEQWLYNHELKEKNDTITLLLREYEEAHGDWLWQIDAQGRLVHLTERMASLLGREAADLVGRHFVTLLAGGDDEAAMRPLALKTLAYHLEGHTPLTDLVVPVTIDDEPRWWQLSAQPLVDHAGEHMGFRGVGSDITEARLSEDKINRMARYDALTGLPNRALLMDGLEEAMTRAHRLKRTCALMFIDLDRFKSINDTLGHQIGDKLLVEVAHRLEDVTDDGHRIGRLGGDEFAIVVREADDELLISQLAEHIIATLSEPYDVDGNKLSIGASVGVAFGPSDGATAHNLIRSADLALYRAKDAGRGVVRRYLPEMHREAEERRQLETELRSALMNGELGLVYQPIFASNSQKIEGFEALLRWTHPALGDVPPDKFVPIAEEAGLITAIGEWVIRSACAEAVNWPADIRLAINLSPVQFTNPNLTAVILSSLSKNGLSPGRLEVEITEGVFLTENALTMATLHQLEAIGIRIALDDFGTGYSSLGYLRKANFSKIKIDRSFVRGAAQNSEESVAIIKAIVALAGSLGMETTAEGAETELEYESARDLGCGQVQGFYFSHPMSPAQALALVSEAGADIDLPYRRTA